MAIVRRKTNKDTPPVPTSVRGATLLAPQENETLKSISSEQSEVIARTVIDRKDTKHQLSNEPDLTDDGHSKAGLSTVAEVKYEWWWKPFLSYTALVLFVLVLTSAMIPVWNWLNQPVEQVEVRGQLRHIEGGLLAQSIVKLVDQGVLETDLYGLQQSLLEHPWVSAAKISRDWPAKLAVQVIEEVPVARWGDEGLLNHQGKIFWPELKPEYATLPRLYGQVADTYKVMAQFHDFNRMISNLDLTITELNVTDHGSWSFTMDNGIQVIVGNKGYRARMERFVSLYRSALVHQAHAIEGIDIRYENGAAIRWKHENQPEGVRS